MTQIFDEILEPQPNGKTNPSGAVRLRVLAITPALPRVDDPGSNAPLLRQIESLRERGIDIDVIDMRGKSALKYLLAIPRMWKKLKHVDLVHGHFGFCGWLGRLQFSKPLVISFMGDDLLGEPKDNGDLTAFSRFMVNANKRLAKLARQVIVKSAEMGNVIGQTKTHVVPNGVDTVLFQPIDRRVARERLGWKQGQLVVLFPGNPANPRKGHRLAVAATKHAESVLGCEVSLQPMWGVAPGDVPLFMNASNAMWMTSSIEGSPNVVKEAMACNLPIVAVPVGDTVQLLADVARCQVCKRDPEQLGVAMANALEAQSDSSGRVALEQMELDLASVAKRVERVYYQALGREQEMESQRNPNSAMAGIR